MKKEKIAMPNGIISIVSIYGTILSGIVELAIGYKVSPFPEGLDSSWMVRFIPFHGVEEIHMV